jgi:S1-C subfamily serine protease/predicted esterase
MRSLVALSLAIVAAGPTAAQDINDKTEAAIKAAVARIAPMVVRIETSGGAELVGGQAGRGGVRVGRGPTTGLVVASDGYIITSSFNFAAKPATIIVSIPGRNEKLVAKEVATDTTRMLTLIKVDATDLPVPQSVPKDQIQVGQWAVAVGRALGVDESAPPSISVGIVSALGRMYGKAIQTDAKVSPVNYGGPLIGIDGRVQGVLVPASPRGDSEAAGVEWYDSGIGFAIPLEDVLYVLPRLREGQNVRRGLLGITAKTTDLYNEPVEIGTVSPDSAAAKAGIKPGDTIVQLDGKPVANYSQLQHILGPKYEGDTIAVTIRRDGQDIDIPAVTLSGAVTAFVNPFLGILPMRDDPEPGVEIRFVFPDSPAAKAGLKAGDRIVKIGAAERPDQPPPPLTALPGHARNALAAAIAGLTPGTDLRLEVKRKDADKTETVTLTLGTFPESLPETIPPQSTVAKALETAKPAAGGLPIPLRPGPKPQDTPPAEEKKEKDPDEKVETGLLKRQNATLGREYWVYVPENYTHNVSHGLIVWLHPAGQGGRDAEKMVEIWRQFCEDQHYILMGPRSQNADGWVPSETESVTQDVQEVFAAYTIDRRRVVAHGMGVGGQMAFYLGFNARDVFRGVATTGASLGTQPKDNVPNQPLAFFIIAGENDPAIREIEQAKPALDEKRFPVIYRVIKDFGKEYTDQKTLIELCVWLDSLDKI